jgi:hypothetical protein
MDIQPIITPLDGAMGTKVQDIAITNRPGRNSFPGSFYFYE